MMTIIEDVKVGKKADNDMCISQETNFDNQ
jgi:hypothetical protein